MLHAEQLSICEVALTVTVRVLLVLAQCLLDPVQAYQVEDARESIDEADGHAPSNLTFDDCQNEPSYDYREKGNVKGCLVEIRSPLFLVVSLIIHVEV